MTLTKNDFVSGVFEKKKEPCEICEGNKFVQETTMIDVHIQPGTLPNEKDHKCFYSGDHVKYLEMM